MKKRSWIIIAAILVVLIAGIAVLAALNAPQGEIESGTISIVQNGETLRVFTMEEITAMDHVEIEKEIVSSSYSNESGLWRGVPLHALLAATDEALLNGDKIAVRAEDGYVGAYSMEEVTDGDNILLVYAKDGAGIGNLENGGTGPFRIIVAEDQFGNRCAKYVYEIEVS